MSEPAQSEHIELDDLDYSEFLDLETVIHSPSQIEQTLFTTVRLAVRREGRDTFGTAFFVHKRVGTKEFKVLVTAKHVVKGADLIRFVVTGGERDDSGQVKPTGTQVTVAVPGVSAMFLDHPSRASLDITAIAWGPVEHAMIRENGSVAYHPSISVDDLATRADLKEVRAGEDALVPCYPDREYGYIQNVPILRRGTLASIPDMDWNGEPEVVLDIAAHKGMSGGPVFTGTPHTFAEKGKVIGVVTAAPLYDYRVQGGEGKVSAHMNIARAVKAWNVPPLIDHLLEVLRHPKG